jgi:hypothetical protein
MKRIINAFEEGMEMKHIRKMIFLTQPESWRAIRLSTRD